MNVIKQEEALEQKNQDLETNDTVAKKHKTNSKRAKKTKLIATIAAVAIFSSAFGALFGFMSGAMGGIFSQQVEKKVQKYFPGINSNGDNITASTQQVIVEDSAVIDVVEKATPAVVSIIISKSVPATPSFWGNVDPFFGGMFGLPQQEQNQDQNQEQQKVGGGSGFFISSDGLILTNKHVVEDKQASYTVLTSDGKQYSATVLARDPSRDAAVIKIEGDSFPVLKLGDSDNLKIGQTTIAIGNSLGEFSNSVSRGIVSGLKRNLSAGSGFSTERLTDIIQTDAAINPGNSGGPLIDVEGNVIGINVAMAQGAQNIGFALPINQAKRIIDQVKSGVKVTVPFLGVRYIAVDSSVQKEAQLPFNYGVLVLRGNKVTDLAVIPGSPADKAGITENDIILEVDGQKLDDKNLLSDMIAKHNVGDKVTLKIWHKGDTKEVQIVLQELKS